MQENKVLTVRLEKELETAIARIARTDGVTKSSVVRTAILRYVEDHEDLSLVRQAHSAKGAAHSMAAVRKALGLN